MLSKDNRKINKNIAMLKQAQNNWRTYFPKKKGLIYSSILSY